MSVFEAAKRIWHIGNVANSVRDANDNDVLTYNAATGLWEADVGGGGASSLDDLSDVTITSGVKGDILAHNGSVFVDLTVGTNDYMLRANSGATEGIEWFDLFGTANTWTANQTLSLANRLTLRGANKYLASTDATTLTLNSDGTLTLQALTGTTNLLGSILTISSANALTCTATAGDSTVGSTGADAVWQCDSAGTHYFRRGGAGSIAQLNTAFYPTTDGALDLGVVTTNAWGALYLDEYDFSQYAQKDPPVATDKFLINDSAAAGALKWVDYADLQEEIPGWHILLRKAATSGQPGDGSAISGLAENTSPDPQDMVMMELNTGGDLEFIKFQNMSGAITHSMISSSHSDSVLTGGGEATGDLLVFAATDWTNMVVSGTDGRVLQEDSGSGTGLSWYTGMKFDSATALTFEAGATDVGLDWSSSGNLFFTVGGGSEMVLTANTLTFNAGLNDPAWDWSVNSNLRFLVGGSLEFSMTAGTITFENGTTDTAINWGTDGILKFLVAGSEEMALSANSLSFEAGATDVGLDWSSSGALNFTVGGATEMTLSANYLRFNNGALDTGLQWASGGYLDFLVNSVIEVRLQSNTLTFNSGTADPGLLWSTDGQLDFTITSVSQIQLVDGELRPTTDSDISLGTTGLRWSAFYTDDIVSGAYDFSQYAEKGSPAGTDHILINDEAAAGALKYVQIANLPGGGGNHNILSATHSDTTGAGGEAQGDLLVRNGSTQWTSLAVGGANTLLHGGTDPSYSAVVTDDITAANVTDAKLADMLAYTIKMRNAGTTGVPGNVKISSLTEEASPAATDWILGEISTGELRKYDVGNLPAGSSPLTTKGDIYVYSTADDRLAVSATDGQVLQADSSAAEGLSYYAGLKFDSATALTFEAGATDVGLAWGTTGQLDLVVGATSEVLLTANKMTFNAPSSDPSLSWATDGKLNFQINSASQVELVDGEFNPTNDSDISLGTTGLRWSALYTDDFITGAYNFNAEYAEKVSPAATDFLLINDEAAAGALKYIQVGNLPAGSSPLTTKGDIYVYSTTDDRLAVSATDGQVLQADSSAAEGLSYYAGMKFDSATALTFEAGATDVGMSWGSSGSLAFTIGGAAEMTLSANELLFEGGATDPAITWGIGSLSFKIGGTWQTTLEANQFYPTNDSSVSLGLTGNRWSALYTDDFITGAYNFDAEYAEKVSPANTDFLLINDEAAAGALKYIQIGNLPGGGGNHNILSATHSDTTGAAGEAKGDLLARNGSSQWTSFPVSATDGQIIQADSSAGLGVSYYSGLSFTSTTALTFEAGATDVGMNWSSGELSFRIGITQEMKLTADNLTFEAGATDVGLGWSTTATLDFTVGGAVEASITTNRLTFNNGAADTGFLWSTDGELAVTVSGISQVKTTDGSFEPATDSDISLGLTGKRWSAFFTDDIVSGAYDFSQYANKATPTTSDHILINDEALAGALKYCTIGNVEAILTLDNLSGTLGISKGGTGQTAQTAAFDALAPTTTKGDVIVHNGSDNIRLAVGTNDHVLTADSTQASGVKWAAAGAGGGTSIIGSSGMAQTTAKGATTYHGIGGDGLTGASSGDDAVVFPCPKAGTLQNLYVNVSTNDTGAAGNTVTVFKNGTTTGITVTYGSGVVGQQSDTSNTASVSAGDELDVQVVNQGSGGGTKNLIVSALTLEIA